MKKYFRIIFSFIAIAALALVVASCGKKNKSTTVPEYTGMTLDTSNSGKQSRYMSAFNPGLLSDIEVPETEDEDADADKDKVEQEVKDSITVNNEMNSNEYYAMPNDKIKVHVHINNPDECAILLFRLNGKTYQTYEFLSGSNSTLIIVEYQLDSTSGFKELTIDNLKYVDNADNQTKDCKMTGADTIKVLVQHTNIPNISISNVETTFTTFSAKVTLKDELNILQPNSAKFAVYEGEDLVKSFDLSVGANTINLDQLAMGVSYSYYAVGAYDVCDGQGAKAYIFDEGKLATKQGYSFDLVGATKDGVEFTSEQATDVATFEKVVLFDAEGKAIKEATAPGSIKFTGLKSNSSYKGVLYYSFMRNGSKVTVGSDIEFDTLATEITIKSFSIINDVVLPGEQINIDVEFNNPDNIRITAFILNEEKWNVLGGDQVSKAQLYFVAPNRANEVFNVSFDAIEYSYNNKLYIQKVEGDYVGTVDISDELGVTGANFISEYSEPGVVLYNDANIVLKFNNPSNYEITKVYTENTSNALVPIKVSDTEYIVSLDWIYNDVRINKFTYLVKGKEVNIDCNHRAVVNAIVGSPSINKISTPEQLAAISANATDTNDYSSGAIYQLQNDIDMKGQTWTPFRFFGVLDGNGYTIKNLQISDSSTESKNFGMFKEVSGLIVNLTLEDFYFNFEYNGGNGGVFIGNAWNQQATIKDCYAKNGTLIVKQGSFNSGYWDKETGLYHNQDSYLGAGTIDNSAISNVKLYVGNLLITTTPETAKPEHNTKGNIFETKSNDNFEFKEFDNFVVITKYLSTATTINLPAKINDKKVLYINNFLTGATTKIRSAIFEEGIETARYTFANCNTLETAVLPSTMVTIGESLFNCCYSLRTCNIPENVTVIANGAFSNCDSLQVELPYGLKTIGDNAFSWNRTSVVYVPKTVTYVGAGGLRLQENCIIVHDFESEIPAGWNAQFNGYSYDSTKTTVIYNDGTKRIFLNVNANKSNDMTLMYNDKLDEEPTISIYNGKIEGWYLDKEFTQAVTFPFEPTENKLHILYAKTAVKATVVFYYGDKNDYGWYNNQYEASGYAPLTVNSYDYETSTKYVEGWYYDESLTRQAEFPLTLTEADVQRNSWIYLYPKYATYKIEKQGDFEYYLNKDNKKVLTSYNGSASEVDLSVLEDLVGIGAEAFKNTSVTSVIIPEGVKTIGNSAFSGCKISSITFPESLQKIGSTAFQNTSLVNVVTPKNVTYIGDNAFSNCQYLKSVKFIGVEELAGNLFNCDWSLTNVELPNTLKTIGNNAFGQTGIRMIVVPESVTTVKYMGLRIDGGVIVVPFAKNNVPSGWVSNWYTEEGWTNAPTIVYSGDDRAVTVLSIKASYDNATQIVYYGKITSAPSINLYNNSTIEGWYLDEDLTQEVAFPYDPDAGVHMLYAKVLGKVTVYFQKSATSQYYDPVYQIEQNVPFDVEYYEYEVTGKTLEGWYLDKELTQKVTFPYTVTDNSITNINFYPKFEDVEEEEVGDFTYYLKDTNKVVVTDYVGDSSVIDFHEFANIGTIVQIGSGAFKNNKDITKVILPEGVTSIGEYAFSGSNLEEITLPSTLKTIGQYAFQNSKIKSIDIPEGVTTINQWTFYNCNSLVDVKLPNGLKTIDTYAFYCCWSLKSIDIPNTVETVGYSAFQCGVRMIDVPASVVNVQNQAFRIDSGGIIIVHFAKKDKPAEWAENFYCYESDSSAPDVVYDDGTKKVTVLVLSDNYNNELQIKFTASDGKVTSSKLPTYAYNSKIVGWYLDKDYTQEVTEFPFTPTENGVTFLYAKHEFSTNVHLSYNGSSYYLDNNYGKVTITLNQVINIVGKSATEVKFYYDADCTQEITEFPVEFEGEYSVITFTIYCEDVE